MAKGEHNAEEHNHNDVGSFIFADDTGQLFADLGAMEYTDANFCQKTRYTFLQNSSLGHSVPIIDGMAQKFGRQFCAKVLAADEKQFCMELQTAYNTDIQRITRSFKMNENGITLIDEYAGAKGHLIKERFVSVIEPKLTDDGIRIGDVFLKADGFSGIKTEILRCADLTNITVYLIDYIVNGDSFEAQIILI